MISPNLFHNTPEAMRILPVSFPSKYGADFKIISYLALEIYFFNSTYFHNIFSTFKAMKNKVLF